MIGFNVKSGPHAISFQNTLYRISEISWIKAAGLSVWQWGGKVAFLLLGVGLGYALFQAKGTFFTLETILVALPLHIAYLIAGDLRLACTGDFEESYDDRVGRSGKLFRDWIAGLAKRRPDWLHLEDGDYNYLVNPEKIAWARPRLQLSYYPLVATVVFFLYGRLVASGFAPEVTEFLADFKVLEFGSGRELVVALSYAIAATGIWAFVVSIKRGIELCAPGGVQDTLWVTGSDLNRILTAMAGDTTVAAPPKSQPVVQQSKPAEPAKPEPEPEPVEAEESAAPDAPTEPAAVD